MVIGRVAEMERLKHATADRLVDAGLVESKDLLSRDGDVVWNRLAEVVKCVQVHQGDVAGLEREDVAQVIGHAASLWYHKFCPSRSDSRETAKYAIGGMLARIFRCLDRTGGEHPQLQLYSAHDSTLIALKSGLRLRHADGRTLNEWPPYASSLRIDLLEGEGDLMVRCVYNWEDMMMDGEHCRNATRKNALVSQPFEEYKRVYPLQAVLADIQDVLAPETRDVDQINEHFAAGS
eukprot:TRINITY_DN49881_c0_g1_i2.p1 TRINITY_DN49881_c0_g1~~TRINITY_DN49881_c0_g1_i2.p1  ORF type:complete len:235 (+),score=42.48 TRINITY_DN49881_c0_g1_i2:202-906(+)